MLSLRGPRAASSIRLAIALRPSPPGAPLRGLATAARSATLTAKQPESRTTKIVGTVISY